MVFTCHSGRVTEVKDVMMKMVPKPFPSLISSLMFVDLCVRHVCICISLFYHITSFVVSSSYAKTRLISHCLVV